MAWSASQGYGYEAVSRITLEGKSSGLMNNDKVSESYLEV